MKLTPEQQALVDHPLNPGDLIKAVAYAGTGKTSTLIAHAKSHRMKGLYIAFNKSVADEATGKFPSNVKCSTIHALAYKALPPSMKKDATAYDVSHKHLRERYSLGTYDATLTIKTLERFMNSADPELDSSHAAPDHLNRYTDLTYPTAVIETAQDLWRRMQLTTDRDVNMTLNGALKMFQLSKPNLKMDIVYLDEAQDTNEVTHDIVINQTSYGARVVLVGDPYQSIYQWRGAVNALDKFRNAPEFRITKTWRFGTQLAECASGILSNTFEEKTPLTGNSDVPTTIVEGNPRDVQGPVTIICRNNVTVIQEAFRQASNFKKIDFIGYKPQEIRSVLDDLIDIFYLSCQLKDKIKNRYIKMFDSVEALKGTSNEKMDTTMLQKVSLALYFGANIAAVVESILGAWDTRTADVKICTAHRSKGLEFQTVALTSDYYDPDEPEETKRSCTKEEIEGEMSVIYVAITRAMGTLILPASFRHLNGGMPFAQMEITPEARKVDEVDDYESVLDAYADQMVDGLSEDEDTVPI